MCGCLALLTIGACKGDTPVTPINSTDPIPNPLGPLALGDVITLNVNINDPCTSPVYHAARVVAISDKALILNDTLNPKVGFTTADFQRFAARFDTLVYPLDVANFGAPLDIDKNGHIAILFTRAVNELTPARSTSYVGGVTFSRDLFPNTATARAQACQGSNQGEYFYMLTPDPLGTINSNTRTAGFVDSNTVAVLAHEFQHLINATRRLYVNDAAAFEDKWLDEALSHVAEELLFFHESGLAPRTNLDYNGLRASSKIATAYNLEMSGNSSRYRTYLQAPSKNSPYSPDDSLETRGAGWSFLRYVLDRVNATDGYGPGVSQSAISTGDVTLTAATVAAEYSITVLNSSLSGGTSLPFTVKANGAPSSLMPLAGLEPAPYVMPVSTSDDNSGVLQRDERFEARLRARERAELGPRFAAARSWYAAQGAPAVMQSRSALNSSTRAGTDAEVLYKLVNSTTIGITNLQSVVNGDLASYVRDWSVSQAVDDVAALNTQFQQRSWNWHSIYAGLLTGGYPLQVTTLPYAAFNMSGTVTAGGASFYKITVPATGSITVNLSAPGGATNTNLQLHAVRTK